MCVNRENRATNIPRNEPFSFVLFLSFVSNRQSFGRIFGQRGCVSFEGKEFVVARCTLHVTRAFDNLDLVPTSGRSVSSVSHPSGDYPTTDTLSRSTSTFRRFRRHRPMKYQRRRVKIRYLFLALFLMVLAFETYSRQTRNAICRWTV